MWGLTSSSDNYNLLVAILLFTTFGTMITLSITANLLLYSLSHVITCFFVFLVNCLLVVVLIIIIMILIW